MSTHNAISISGGKDSTALALLAVEREIENLQFVFADTGHEHPETLEYVAYLSGELERRCGVGVRTVRADFSDRIATRRANLPALWESKGIPQEQIDKALEALRPTGNPFLDLCLLKGRFPSTRARFCTQELKVGPIEKQVMQPLLSTGVKAVVSWQGVRREESASRANLPAHDVEFGQWEPDPRGLLIYRPILDWTAADVFAFHEKHGVKPNPLYTQGMGRVGCMPCIMASKGELREIASRWPEEIARVREWERLVQQASKRGLSSFFAADKTPEGRANKDATDADIFGIEAVVEWSKTGRGGRQLDLLATDEPAQCSSIYGLCE